ncbi:hypothetical protein THAOC_26497, partial [Thalassiosira oceanica]
EQDVPDDLESFEEKCSLTRVAEFLELGLSTRRRLVLVLCLGVMHFLLSTHTVKQVLDGLKEEEGCIGSIRALAGQLGASAGGFKSGHVCIGGSEYNRPPSICGRGRHAVT